MSGFAAITRTGDFAVIDTRNELVAATTGTAERAEAIADLLNDGTLTLDTFGRVDWHKRRSAHELATGMLPPHKAVAARLAG